MTRKFTTGKTYKGKNGYVSSFRKVTTNEGFKWLRVSKTPKPKKSK